MNLLRQLSPFFEASVRERGDKYDRENRVELEAVEPGSISARVAGTAASAYWVELSWEDEDPLFLLGTCSCPHYDRGEFCKHIWATLKIFEDGFWETETDPEQIVLQHEMDLDEPLDGPRRSPATATGTNGTQRGTVDTGGHAGLSGKHWAALLQRAGSTNAEQDIAAVLEQSNEPDREMWLLIDAERSSDTGTLIVEHYFRQLKRNGEYGKVRREGVSRADLTRYRNATDRELLGLLIGSEDVGTTTDEFRNSWDNTERARRTSRQVVTQMYDLVLPGLCATDRLVWTDFQNDGNRSPPLESLHALAWDDGPQWYFALNVDHDTAADTTIMSGRLERTGQRRELQDVVVALEDGLVIFRDSIGRLGNGLDAAWINTFKASPEQPIPAAELDDFITHWWTLRYRPRANLPARLELTPFTLKPTGHIAVKARERGAYVFSAERRVDVSFDYSGHRIAFDAKQGAIVDQSGGRVLERDAAHEVELLEQLRLVGVKLKTGYYGNDAWYAISERRINLLSRSLLESGWSVEIEGVMLRQSTAFEVKVSSGIDWFDLDAEVDFGGQRVELPDLLAARAAGSNHVTLADGTIGMLPDAWLDEYERLSTLGTMEKGRLRMRRTQATMLDLLLRESEASALQVDEQFTRWREQLMRVKGVEPATEPLSFIGELRPYQRVGLGWLQFLDELGVGGCLADDMGLGKTVQVIALLLHSKVEARRGGKAELPSLVVVPRSLVWNWRAELERFAPTLSLLEYSGQGRRDNLAELSKHDVIITTYGTLRRDIAEMREVQFQYAILDEAQAIKNSKSQAAKACRLIVAKQRLAITGTPVENHLGELWSLFEFLNPGLLGSATAFSSLAKGVKGRTSTEAAQMLSQGLRPFILRRTKKEVLTDLPVKTEQTLMCELSAEQREHYDELRDYYRRSLDERIGQMGMARSKIHVLEALLRLRQAACHPGLIDPSRNHESSAKLAVLMERLEDVVAEGHKALVFSQFTKLLAIVRRAADAKGLHYSYLDGKTRNREQRVAEFQNDPDCSVFLISLKAGGHGLNLTAADYVFILDPWWNPAVEAQAIDRAHRIGQTRSVFAYRLIAKDTVEEKIIQLQAQKRELADAIVAADESLIRGLGADDLAILLG